MPTPKVLTTARATMIAMMTPAENIISLFSPITAITRMAKQDVDKHIAYIVRS